VNRWGLRSGNLAIVRGVIGAIADIHVHRLYQLRVMSNSTTYEQEELCTHHWWYETNQSHRSTINHNIIIIVIELIKVNTNIRICDTLRLQSALTNKLAGLMSRWITFCAWTYRKPRNI
jgi:hypothetical protein